MKIIENLTEAQLIATYIVQKMGSATIANIVETAATALDCNFGPNNNLLTQALKGLKKRDIIAENQRPVGANSKMVKVWEMKKLGWKSPPEYAHVGDLLPELLRTVELEDLKSGFDKKEKQGDEKAGRGNIIDEYRSYLLRVRTLTPLLGSQIPSEMMLKARGVHEKDEDITGNGIFERDLNTKEIIITPDVQRGWFRTNVMHPAGLPAARADYVAFQPIRIPADAPMEEVVLPVQSANGPAAPKKYEALLPGVEFEIRFSAPVKGFLAPDQLERMLWVACLQPRRGLSPARGTRYGTLLPISFEQLGKVKEGPLDHLLAGVPAELRQQYAGYLDKTVARLSGVKIAGVVNSKGMDDLEAAEAAEVSAE